MSVKSGGYLCRVVMNMLCCASCRQGMGRFPAGLLLVQHQRAARRPVADWHARLDLCRLQSHGQLPSTSTLFRCTTNIVVDCYQSPSNACLTSRQRLVYNLMPLLQLNKQSFGTSYGILCSISAFLIEEQTDRNVPVRTSFRFPRCLDVQLRCRVLITFC